MIELDVIYDNDNDREHVAEEIEKALTNLPRIRHKKKNVRLNKIEM